MPDPCHICAHPDGEACAQSRALHEEVELERGALMTRLGLAWYRNPISGVHHEWEARPEPKALFAFLADLED